MKTCVVHHSWNIMSILKLYLYFMFMSVSSVQLVSRVWLFVTTSTVGHQASLSITSPGAYRNSCPLRRWWHSTISFSVIHVTSCLQSFPTSGTFPMSQFFTSGSQSMWVWINIYCTFAALSWRNRRMVMNAIHKIQMFIKFIKSHMYMWVWINICCAYDALSRINKNANDCNLQNPR